ncbi:MAG TPA: SDR family oxidoreductase [Gammaproteobacteria bacterium]|nr:SDR family oxidoreductase [Gammaproteobacteria bacterium]
MKNERKREVVVITGAGAGLGRATVREFARHGADIGLIARGADRLEAARAEVEQCGGRALVSPADVADANAVEAAAERIESGLGPIAIWVNVAMATVFGYFTDIAPEDFRRVTEVTYLGNVYATQAALKRMQPRNFGTIVQVGSALAYRSVPLQSAYCGAKHAIQGYTESIRSELLKSKSRVHLTIVEMPALNTPQFDWCKNTMAKRARPVAPVFQPEVGARAIYWAAHHRRRQLYVGFPAVKAIWANKFIPGILDRMLVSAIAGQQTDQSEDANRPFNLYDPVAGDTGAHGRFDDESRTRSLELWFATHLLPSKTSH